MTTTTIRLVAGLALAALFPADALGQGLPEPEPPRGAFSAVSLGLVFDDGDPNQGSRFSYKVAGTPGPVDYFPAYHTPAVPEFTDTKLEQYIDSLLTVGARHVDLDIDGISTGNDINTLVLNENANPPRFEFAPDLTWSWNTLFVSVAQDARGLQGSWIENRRNNTPEGPGAEVLGFYVETSVLPDPLAGRVFLEQGLQDFQGNVPTPPNNRTDIVALDVFMPLIIERNGQPDPVVMPNTTFLYFSVTSACATELRAQQLKVDNETVDVYGASILSVEWDGASQSWSNFKVAKHPSEMGLTTVSDIDALAVGRRPGEGHGGLLGPQQSVWGPTYIFSLRNITGNEEQILVHAKAGATAASATPRTGVPRRQNGLTIPQGAGIDVGQEIDGLCSGDPEGGSIPSAFAAPIRHPFTPAEPLLHLSATRVAGAAGGEKMRFVISGWAGQRATQNSLVRLNFTSPSAPFHNAWQYFDAIRPASAQAFTFDSLEFPQLPWPLEVEFYAHQLGFDPGSTLLTSYRMKINID